jgi:hypothetical protein
MTGKSLSLLSFFSSLLADRMSSSSSTAQVVTCATDVRQGMQRSGAKFYISEKEYFASRQEKLKVQFRRDGGEDAEVRMSEVGDGEVSGGEIAQSSVTSATQRKNDGKTSKSSESGGSALPVKQIFGESAFDPISSSNFAD